METNIMTISQQLAHCSGTEGYHRFNMLFRNVIATDGMMFLAKNGGNNGAFWLLEAIASHLKTNFKLQKTQQEGLLFWNLTLNKNDNGCVLTCKKDSDQPDLVRQEIKYTDIGTNLGANEIKIWSAPQDKYIVLMLPSEY